MLPDGLTDMRKMIEDLFFLYPHLCGYLPGRKGALIQQGYDRRRTVAYSSRGI